MVAAITATVLSVVPGVTLGLLSGYAGARLDNFIMRVADVQLSFPTILMALLIDGLARPVLPKEIQEQVAIWVVVAAIGLSNWVQYARPVRGVTMVEQSKDYVNAARLIGL